MRLSKYEKETIILTNEGNTTPFRFTHSTHR